MMEKSNFSRTLDNKKLGIFGIGNKNGLEAYFTNYGARMVSLIFPDIQGRATDMILGFDSLDAYLQSPDYMGALVGRVANRIENAIFSLNNKEYKLDHNVGDNHLHGGLKGFSHQVWDVKSCDDRSITFGYFSPDLDQNYPGNMHVSVCYSINDKNELSVDIDATTDKDTIVNMTIHPYFNLNGKGKILNHLLKINADKYLPINSELIPVGVKKIQDNSAFDFRNYKAIGKDIYSKNEQLESAGGYDHNFVVSGKIDDVVVSAIGDISRIKMEVLSNQIGMQLYTGNFISEKPIGKNKVKYGRYSAFCIEPQAFPNSPNHHDFPSIELKAGEKYKHQSIFRFSIEK